MLGFFIESYFYGFSMMDYSCERHRLNMSESIHFIRQHRGMAIGNGMVFYLFMLIPILGWMLAPSYAVIAATIDLQTKRLK
jgi:CysZ protein